MGKAVLGCISPDIFCRDQCGKVSHINASRNLASCYTLDRRGGYPESEITYTCSTQHYKHVTHNSSFSCTHAHTWRALFSSSSTLSFYSSTNTCIHDQPQSCIADTHRHDNSEDIYARIITYDRMAYRIMGSYRYIIFCIMRHLLTFISCISCNGKFFAVMEFCGICCTSRDGISRRMCGYRMLTSSHKYPRTNKKSPNNQSHRHSSHSSTPPNASSCKVGTLHNDNSVNIYAYGNLISSRISYRIGMPVATHCI